MDSSEHFLPAEEHWDILSSFREAVEGKFRREVLISDVNLASYDKVISTAMEALDARGLDLADPGHRYVTATVMAWTLNTVIRIAVSECQDPHVLGHLANAVLWPAYVVRELTLDQPLPEEAPDALPEV